ncbi:hypothetical protein VTL71DRAFT_7592 [Oculimacula yallundae]|uniref:Uncharacterized protein n=1 Tax=Oculimacula yallundae TaxID=86028 RepID=A0ABR4BUK9_9HELO
MASSSASGLGGPSNGQGGKGFGSGSASGGDAGSHNSQDTPTTPSTSRPSRRARTYRNSDGEASSPVGTQYSPGGTPRAPMASINTAIPPPLYQPQALGRPTNAPSRISADALARVQGASMIQQNSLAYASSTTQGGISYVAPRDNGFTSFTSFGSFESLLPSAPLARPVLFDPFVDPGSTPANAASPLPALYAPPLYRVPAPPSMFGPPLHSVPIVARPAAQVPQSNPGPAGPGPRPAPGTAPSHLQPPRAATRPRRDSEDSPEGDKKVLVFRNFR